MAKKQTRRSISVSAVAFDRAHGAAERAGVSLSRFTEVALGALIQTGPTPEMMAMRIMIDDPARPSAVTYATSADVEPTAFAHSTSMDDDESDGVQVVYDEEP